MSVVSLYCLFADRDEAQRIGRQMIEERMAACVNILGSCQSIFRWQGVIETSEEVAAIFKTRSDRADALIARITELHSYDVPAMAVWPIDRLPADYADWVEANSG